MDNKGCMALKLECTVEADAACILDGQSKICNWSYNHLLEEAAKLKEEFIKTQDPEIVKTLYTERGLRDLLPSLKDDHGFLRLVHSSPLKNAALRVSAAIQAYQDSRKGRRKGNKTGWPKFRSWKKHWFSLFYDEPNKGFKVHNDTLTLSLGTGMDGKRRRVVIKMQDAHLLLGKEIRNVRITKTLGKFYAIFTVTKLFPLSKPITKVIALDPNHKNLAYGVDTDGQALEIATPSWIKTYDKRLDELTSKRARCQRKSKKITLLDEQGNPTGKVLYQSSRRWERYNQALQKALHKRREQIKTFMYTLANALYTRYDCVAIGDYTPHGEGITSMMRRAMNNRSVIGAWKHTLAWVALKSGKSFVEFEEKNTTRTCSQCQKVEENGIPVSLRQWCCAGCQTVHIRDENAAINGLRKTLRDLSTKGKGETPLLVSGSDLVVQQRWAWCVFPCGVQKTLQRENCNKYCNTRKLKRERGSSRSSLVNCV